MQIGFVGLGAMGRAIAHNLLSAGHQVLLWNRSPVPDLATVEDVTDLASVDVLFSMLAHDAAVRNVLLTHGLLEVLKPGAIHVNLATISAELARELVGLHSAREVDYVTACVLGRPEAAAAAKLHVLTGGTGMERVRPLLERIGQKIWHFGDDPVAANVVKLAANLTLACAVEAMGESSALVVGHGVSKVAFLEMLTSTVMASPAYQIYGKIIADESYEKAGFPVALGLKDVKLALAAGEQAHVPLPFGSVCRDGFLDCLAHGEGELDWAALAKAAQRRAGQQ